MLRSGSKMALVLGIYFTTPVNVTVYCTAQGSCLISVWYCLMDRWHVLVQYWICHFAIQDYNAYFSVLHTTILLDNPELQLASALMLLNLELLLSTVSTVQWGFYTHRLHCILLHSRLENLEQVNNNLHSGVDDRYIGASLHYITLVLVFCLLLYSILL